MKESANVGRSLLHPIVLLALALWVLNDHVLKNAYPSELTGKLSDVASLIVFPLLATAAVELMRGKRSDVVLVVWVILTGVVMATINVFDASAEAYRIGLAAAQWPFLALGPWLSDATLPPLHRVDLTMDPTDLWTLPALLVPLAIGWSRQPLLRPVTIIASHTRHT